MYSNDNPFKDKNLDNQINVTNIITQGDVEPKSREKKNHLINTSSYKTNDETNINSDNNLLMKSIRKEKKNEAKSENNQERMDDNYCSYNNCLTLEKGNSNSKRIFHIKSANKLGTSLRKENNLEKSKTKIFSKDPKRIYLYPTKENELPADQLGKGVKTIVNNNITGLKSSSIPIVERNINFVRVDLPLILPNLSSQNNNSPNTNIFKNNKIRKSSNKKF